MKNTDLTQLNASSKNTMMETLGIEYTQVGEDFICGKMPVDNRTHQPMGIMHGGASAALIETLGSIGNRIFFWARPQYKSYTSSSLRICSRKGNSSTQRKNYSRVASRYY